MKEGDRNTHFFHVRDTSRRKKNSIERLKDLNRCWKDNNADICAIAREYFHNLFESTLSPYEVLNLDYIDNCISDNMKERLTKDFTDKEIVEPFNQMDPRKAPEIDGLSGCLFEENWKVVGTDVFKLWHEVLEATEM